MLTPPARQGYAILLVRTMWVERLSWPSFHQVGEDNQVVFLAMEYLEGMSLADGLQIVSLAWLPDSCSLALRGIVNSPSHLHQIHTFIS